ncbi:potassium channel family protein [Myxococcus faecalis]|jgi:trk system potassium uptake protein TrkA|uniref:potassium channel family protein n=1 Tax=Myxococcus TaxID=32 RepID=UPI001CC15EA5|nr:TrkA family potassium uptake protein [Myxococcus sp. XM-1-1-1]MBZ4409684.1 TrkA family potassium uptake protein [Myxococcus sp. XM-1-1-1]BDT32095.1 TrkA family potassium uptake protein [Myxococcus sp. MH1]
MKRIIVVGLGNFGSVIAARLHEQGHDVIAIDPRPAVVDALGSRVSKAMVGDATQRQVLQEVGARGADAAIVSTGEDLSASILALLALRDTGIQDIYVKVRSDDHARIVNALGASESIFPERESALGLANRITSGRLLQYVQLGQDFGLQEMPVPEAWYGRSLRELALPQRYRVHVVAVHDVLQDRMLPVPDPDRPLTPSDALLVAGEPSALAAVAVLK